MEIDPHPTRWILSNIMNEGDSEHGLGGLPKFCIIEKAGKKIGFIYILRPL